MFAKETSRQGVTEVADSDPTKKFDSLGSNWSCRALDRDMSHSVIPRVRVQSYPQAKLYMVVQGENTTRNSNATGLDGLLLVRRYGK